MARCPNCNEEGLEVELITVANHAKEECWPLGEEKYFFCERPTCDAIYFTSSGGRVLKKVDVKTRVTFKESDLPKPLCYCKQVTEEDVVRAIEAGADTFEKVKVATDIGGGGHCKITNPVGRCCSRNYTPFIKMELERHGHRSKPNDGVGFMSIK